MRFLLSMILCLMMASEAQAVRLMDGEAVGLMFGYVAACAKHVDMNPPSMPEDKMVGERYAMWLKKNGANVGKVVRDLKGNLGIGMATAARSNYSNCEGALLEMIGFHEYFNLKGESLRPILEKYAKPVQAQTQVPQAEKVQPAKSNGQQVAITLGDYAVPEGGTGGMRLSIGSDNKLEIGISTSNEVDGASCEFVGNCIVKDNKIECSNNAKDPDDTASLLGTTNGNNINFTSGNTRNVCDPRGSLFGVYKLASAATATKTSTDDVIPPLGTLTLKDDFTSSTMKLRYDEDGNLLMVIKSISTDKVKCVFEGICDVINGTKLECRQYIGDKEVYAAGDFTDTTIEIIPSSSAAICPKGGVIDGAYKLKN